MSAEKKEIKVPCKVKSSNIVRAAHKLFFDRAPFDKNFSAECTGKLAPKVLKIYENITKLPGKHVVYSSDINFLKVMGGYLVAQNYDFAINPKTLKMIAKNPRDHQKRFAALPGSTMFGKPVPMNLKTRVLDAFNSDANVMGEDTSVLLISSVFREGISIMDVTAMHIVEPFVRETEKTQAIGRVIRYCSHKRTPWQKGGWVVKVFTYDITFRGVSMTNLTMETSLLRDHIISIAVDLPLTRPKSKPAKAAALQPLSSGDVQNRNLIELVLVAFATRMKPSEFHVWYRAWWKGLPGRQNLRVKAPSAYKKIARECLKQFLVQALKGSSVAKQQLAQVWKNSSLYIRSNLAAISETRDLWKSHINFSTMRQINRSIDQLDIGIDHSPDTPTSKFVLPTKPFVSIAEAHAFINANWMAFAWPVAADGEVANKCDQKASPLLSQTQKFVSNYFVPECPFKGFIAYHSVGSGKTITGAKVCERFHAEGYTCVWITRTSLRGGLEEDFAKVNVPKNVISEILSYKMASNAMFKNAHGGEDKRFKGNGRDQLFKTLLVIDEVHLLFNGSLSSSEAANLAEIEQAVAKSYKLSGQDSCRVFAMSATPDESTKVWNGIHKLCGGHEYGNVSYLDNSKDTGSFATPEFIDASVEVPKDHPVLKKLLLCDKSHAPSKTSLQLSKK